MASEILFNTGSGNGLTPDGTKPLSETDVDLHIPTTQTFSSHSRIMLNNQVLFEIFPFEITTIYSSGQWINDTHVSGDAFLMFALHGMI